jgi:hypothetical protein
MLLFKTVTQLLLTKQKYGHQKPVYQSIIRALMDLLFLAVFFEKILRDLFGICLGFVWGDFGSSRRVPEETEWKFRMIPGQNPIHIRTRWRASKTSINWFYSK